MANSTSFLGCNHSYDVFTENLKYLFQLLYLVPALFLLIRMIYVITISHWDDYAKQPFWTLYLIDCVVALLHILSDIFYFRLTIFVPQICESFSFFLRANPLLIHITFPLWYYLHAAKMLCQVFISIERVLSSAMSTAGYRKFFSTKKPMRWVAGVVLVFPLTLIWNILISEKYIQFYFGGFSPGYARRVNWFGTTAVQLKYMQISMFITVITFLITIYFFFLQSARPPLSLVWLSICLEYLLCAILFCYLHMHSFDFQYNDLIYVLVFFVWDGFNILSPVTMVIGYGKLRKQVFTIGAEEDHVFYQQ